VPESVAKIGRLLGHGSGLCFVSRQKPMQPPVTQSQFCSWARALGVPIAAYNNRTWLTRIPDGNS
jgi:hypothetical protein